MDLDKLAFSQVGKGDCLVSVILEERVRIDPEPTSQNYQVVGAEAVDGALNFEFVVLEAVVVFVFEHAKRGFDVIFDGLLVAGVHGIE